MLKKEVKPYWNLSVKVLHGNIKMKCDYFSEADCYVILNLPTASARTYRTKTIDNSNTPIWNETFHFRLQSNVKNILEFQVYDSDQYRDDLIGTVLFDTDNLTPEKIEKKCFILNDKTKDELWVEFEMTKSSEMASPCMSNGVLVECDKALYPPSPKLTLVVLSTAKFSPNPDQTHLSKLIKVFVITRKSQAGPFCELTVGVDKLFKNSGALRNMVLNLKGAYKEDHVISQEEDQKCLKPLCYYINRNLETELNLTSKNQVDGANQNTQDTGTSIPLIAVSSNYHMTMSLPLAQEKVDVELKADDRVKEELDVRLEFDIPKEEKNFLVKRSKVVSEALQKVLNLTTTPEPRKVPVIAVVCSGGGTRAMTGTYGALRGLQKLQLLDAVSYITGLSGSTWTLASLYEDPNWSKSDIIKFIECSRKEISKSTFSIFSREQLSYYKKKMEERGKEGHIVSLIDMWGLAIEYLIQGKKPFGTLTDMQKAVSEGQNPLPIFTAVNMKDGKLECTAEAEWCEFTPYEVGISKYGGFVPAQNFGSEHYLGHLVKKVPETMVSFLLGIWSSVFSLNLTSIWQHATGITPSWTQGAEKEASNTKTDNKPRKLSTSLLSPVADSAKRVSSFMNSRPIISQMSNFLRGLQLHRDYSENSAFVAWKEKHADAFPNTLTPMDSLLSLVDGGFAINSGFIPVLGSQRHADVILSLNYSWNPDQFKILKQTYDYCIDRKIPFPKIDFKKVESEPIQEVYVFEDQENPEAPIVIHFPLVNITYKQFRAPGVKRVGEMELKEGDVNVNLTGDSSPYITRKITYTPEDYDKLINLTSYNILNNKDVILKTLNQAVKRKSK